MKTAYWHTYLTNDPGTWSGIAMEQLAAMEQHGLLNELDKLKITCIARGDSYQWFEGLVHSMVDRHKVEWDWVQNPYEFDLQMINGLNSEKLITENHTMRKIYKDCLDTEQLVLYLHTKGITATKRFLESGDYATYRNYYFWRQFLNWGVIDKWRDCVSHLLKDGADIVGPNFQRYPEPHYSGAFWWAKSSHICQLPDPSTLRWWRDIQARTTDQWLKTAPDRFRDEMWPCSAELCSCFDIGNGHPNPANSYFPKSMY